MEYRKLGQTGLNAAIIGLGMEHLHPTEIAPVVHRALDRGINYIDLMMWTAETQAACGLALQGRRDGVILAGHLGVAETRGQYRRTRDVAECEALFHDLLARLRTGHVEVLHLTYVDKPKDYKQIVRPGGVLELALRLKREGKARFLGLSGHNPVVAAWAVESGHLDVVMQIVNIRAAGDPDMARLRHLCAARGVGLVVMKTFAGGECLRGESPLSPAQCIGYSLSQPGVSTVLVGVKNAGELETGLAYLQATEEERDYAAAAGRVARGLAGTCVYCNHCLPCPSVIDVAAVIRLTVAAAQYGISSHLQAGYDALPVKASDCVECGECVERCPFDVDIIGKMRQAVGLFEAVA